MLAVLLLAGCDDSAASKAPADPTSPTKLRRPVVASLSPACTDILLAVGARDHLAAVSTYDRGKPAVRDLPAAGDHLGVDWERLGRLRPDVLVVQAREALAPAGFKRRADALGIRPVYVQIDTLADISAATRAIGGAIGESAKADAADRAMRAKLDAVARSVAGRRRVATLLVTDEGGAGAAGPGTFLDDLLTVAGGANVVAGGRVAYPGLDREKIVALRPRAVLHLLPEQPAPVIADAKRFWASMPDVPAVKSGRVYYLTDASIMHPGLKVGDVAEQFAARLHPQRPAWPGTVAPAGPAGAACGTSCQNLAYQHVFVAPAGPAGAAYVAPIWDARPVRVLRDPGRSERFSTSPRAATVETLRCARDDPWTGRRDRDQPHLRRRVRVYSQDDPWTGRRDRDQPHLRRCVRVYDRDDPWTGRRDRDQPHLRRRVRVDVQDDPWTGRRDGDDATNSRLARDGIGGPNPNAGRQPFHVKARPAC